MPSETITSHPEIENTIVSKPLPVPLSIRWISGEPNTPGHKYRVERPLAAAAALGLDAAWIGVGDVGEKLNQIETADIIVLWRTIWNDVLAAAVNNAKSNGTKVVFDIDDLMVDPELARLEVIDGIRSQGLTEETVRAHYAGIRAAMASADLCIASTEELAVHMRRALMPALVLPNSFDERTRAASRIASRIRASESASCREADPNWLCGWFAHPSERLCSLRGCGRRNSARPSKLPTRPLQGCQHSLS